MKKTVFFKWMGTLCLVFLLAFNVTGCGKGAEEKVSLTILVGAHGNSMEIPLNSATLSRWILETCSSFGDICMINVDGNPVVKYQATIPEPKVSGLSSNKLKSIAEGNAAEVKKVLQTVTAETEEVDTLRAIQMGAQSLQSTDQGKKVLLILDSGLCTTGQLDIREGFLKAKSLDEVVEGLRSLGELPDLNGVDVIWSYCGETAPPQDALSELDKKKLKGLWESVLRAAGAKSVTFSVDFNSSVPYTGMPSVSVVETDRIRLSFDKISMENVKIDLTPIDTFVLDETRVRFVGDQAVFVDERAAEGAVQEIADELLAHKDNQVYIIGTTATGNEAFCQNLSRDRAEAVKSMLIEMGVEEDRMLVYGLGFNDPWHQNDVETDGTWKEEAAVLNRKVLVIDVNSAEAKKLQGVN